MRKKLAAVSISVFVGLTGFAVANLGSGVAATNDTTTGTSTGTSTVTSTVTNTGTTTVTSTASTTTASSTTTATSTTTPTHTVTVTVTSGGQTTTVVVSGKVLLCHYTHSKKHPYVLIKVSASGLRGHLRHGDQFPSNGTCAAATRQFLKTHGPHAHSNSSHGKGHNH